MKTAIIHDWLVTIGGSEKVLEAILDLYPSPIYTLVKDEKMLRESPFADQLIEASFLQKFPGSSKWYRNYLPFFPSAIERFKLESYDLILSSSHAVAKGIIKHENQLHLCYCHTPMRYAWDLYKQYMGEIKGARKGFAKWILRYLRNWDFESLNRVDHFIANSQFIAERIKKNYGRDATVIYPPVKILPFEGKKKENFYLTVSRMVPYKRIDLIVEAFSHLPDKRLVVIGDGPELGKIKIKAGKNVEILHFQPDEVVRDYSARAKGFIFAAEEDFGIAPVEAQAAGTAVIAYAKGGVLESVTDKTGLFFDEQSVASLVEAIEKFEKMEFDPSVVRKNAERFSEERFKREFQQFVNEKWEEFCENRHSSRRERDAALANF